MERRSRFTPQGLTIASRSLLPDNLPICSGQADKGLINRKQREEPCTSKCIQQMRLRIFIVASSGRARSAKGRPESRSRTARSTEAKGPGPGLTTG